jgi:hypothetical protein
VFGSPSTSEMSSRNGSAAGLRREISPAWRRNQQQREGEKERRARAFYRCRRGEETGNVVKGIEGGVIGGFGRYSGVITGWRKTKLRSDVRARAVSEGRRGAGYRFGLG